MEELVDRVLVCGKAGIRIDGAVLKDVTVLLNVVAQRGGACR